MNITFATVDTGRCYRVTITIDDLGTFEANFPISFALDEAEATARAQELWTSLLVASNNNITGARAAWKAAGNALVEADKSRREQLITAIEGRWTWICTVADLVDGVPTSTPLEEALRNADDVAFWRLYSDLKSTREHNVRTLDRVIKLITSKPLPPSND